MTSRIFSYTDYRKFILDRILLIQSQDRRCTYRVLAEQLGFKSAGFITQIVKGQVNISPESAGRFCELFALKKKEREYFLAMVRFNQAKRHDEKRACFEEMVRCNTDAPRVLKSDQYAFYDKWYYAAIRELLDIVDCSDENVDIIGKRVEPPLSARETAKAISVLEKTGLIKRDENGVYRKTDAVISSGYDAHATAINGFVLQSLKLAGEAIDRFPREDRNLSWMTLSMSEKSFLQIQEELRAFRARALEIARTDGEPERVYQFNFQIFPLSSKKPQGDVCAD